MNGADPRTDPNSYGPPQQGQVQPSTMPVPNAQPPVKLDIGPKITQALDAATPEELHFARSIAGASKNRSSFDTVMDAAFTGQGPDDLREYAQAEEAANSAMELAKESMKMSQKEFDSLLQSLDSEVGQSPDMPVKGTPNMPSDQLLALAGGLALADPRHGFDILAQPFLYELAQTDQRYAQDQLKFQVYNKRRDEKIGLIQSKLEGAARRQDAAAKEFYRLSEDAAKRGDQRRAKGFEQLHNFAAAKTETELDSAVSVLQSYFPEMAPSPVEIAGARKRIQDELRAEAEKDKLTQDKAKWDTQEKIVDNRRADLLAAFPQGASITKEQSDAFNKETAEIRKQHPEIDAGRWVKAYPRVSNAEQNLDFRGEEFKWRKDRDKAEDTKWETKGRAEGWLTGPIGNPQPVVGFKDKRERGNKIAAIDKEIGKLREEADSLQNAPFLANPDAEKAAEESRDRRNKLYGTVRQEWLRVKAKAEMLGSRAPAFEQYVQARYPQLQSFWDSVGNVIGNVKGRGGTPKGTSVPKSVSSGGFKIEVER